MPRVGEMVIGEDDVAPGEGPLLDTRVSGLEALPTSTVATAAKASLTAASMSSSCLAANFDARFLSFHSSSNSSFSPLPRA